MSGNCAFIARSTVLIASIRADWSGAGDMRATCRCVLIAVNGLRNS